MELEKLRYEVHLMSEADVANLPLVASRVTLTISGFLWRVRLPFPTPDASTSRPWDMNGGSFLLSRTLDTAPWPLPRENLEPKFGS